MINALFDYRIIDNSDKPLGTASITLSMIRREFRVAIANRHFKASFQKLGKFTLVAEARAITQALDIVKHKGVYVSEDALTTHISGKST